MYLLASLARNRKVKEADIPVVMSKKFLSKVEMKMEIIKIGKDREVDKKGRTKIYFSPDSDNIVCIKIKKEEEKEELFYQELDTMLICKKEAEKLGIPYSQEPLGRCIYEENGQEFKALAYRAKKDSFVYVNEIDDDETQIEAMKRGLKLYASLSANQNLHFYETCGLSHGEGRTWNITEILFRSEIGGVREKDFLYPNMTKESIRDTGDFWRIEHHDEKKQYNFTDQKFKWVSLEMDSLLYYNIPLHQAFSAMMMYVSCHRDQIHYEDEEQIEKYVDLFCEFFGISMATFHKKEEEEVIDMIKVKYREMIRKGLLQLFYFIDPRGLKFEVDHFKEREAVQHEKIYNIPLSNDKVESIISMRNYEKMSRIENFGLPQSSFPAPQLIEAYLYVLGQSIVWGKCSNHSIDMKKENEESELIETSKHQEILNRFVFKIELCA